MPAKPKILSMIAEFLTQYPESFYSFARPVLDDGHVDPDSIQMCLEPDKVGEWTDHALAHDTKMDWVRVIDVKWSTITFLHELLELPESEFEAVYNYYETSN